MGRKRSTRQLMIDWCQANENSVEVIIGRIESILATYQEGALEHTPEVFSALEAGYLFRTVIQRLTQTVRDA